VGGEIEGLLMAYKEVLNGMLADIWSAIEWRTRPVKGKRQARRIPYLRIDRQLNAAVNIYMRMEGVPHDVVWWDATVLPALVGGYVLTGAERRVPDEPGRGLYDYDAMKPKLHYAYNRYEDAYLPMRT
jgi:hypothetical protein